MLLVETYGKDVPGVQHLTVRSPETEWCDLIRKETPLHREIDISEPGEDNAVQIDDLRFQVRNAKQGHKSNVNDCG